MLVGKKTVFSYSPRLSFALGSTLGNSRLWRGFGHVNLAAHKLGVSSGLTCAIHSVLWLRLGYGARYKLTGGPFCPVGVPVGSDSLRRNREFRHGVTPGQTGLAAAGVGLTECHGAGGGITPVIMIGRRCGVPLHSGFLNVADSLPVDFFLLAELQSQRIHVFVMKYNVVFAKAYFTSN